jgi:hypothetical protein
MQDYQYDIAVLGVFSLIVLSWVEILSFVIVLHYQKPIKLLIFSFITFSISRVVADS